MTAKEYKEARKKLGSQAHVARLLGVSRQLVCMREGGEAKITKEAVLAMERLLP